MRHVGALVYPNFELLDLFGPLEMLGWLGDEFRISLIGPARGAVACNMGPSVVADCSMDEAAAFDVLLVPGGWGRSIPVDTDALLPWLNRAARQSDYVLSVCTGAALLALSGFLDGRPATTNKALFHWVAEKRPQVHWQAQARWVQDGRLFTSSGVSAGMDMTLAALAEILGADAAEMVALGCEYTARRNAGDDPFARLYGLV